MVNLAQFTGVHQQFRRFGFGVKEIVQLDAQSPAGGLGRGTVIASDGRLLVLTEEGELQIGPASPDGFEPTHTTRALPEGPC